jgi:transcriptional coactivator HFI1/ADA1
LSVSPGHLNQNELSLQIDYYVTADPNTEHLHNQLIAGIYGNVNRDCPEPGVAPWVSANDKPTVLSKPVSGDAAEQRLKMEVMQLQARERRRVKEVPDVRRPACDPSRGLSETIRLTLFS